MKLLIFHVVKCATRRLRKISFRNPKQHFAIVCKSRKLKIYSPEHRSRKKNSLSKDSSSIQKNIFFSAHKASSVFTRFFIGKVENHFSSRLHTGKILLQIHLIKLHKFRIDSTILLLNGKFIDIGVNAGVAWVRCDTQKHIFSRLSVINTEIDISHFDYSSRISVYIFADK